MVQTSEGDINDGTNGNNASNNDFTKSVDLSDPALTEIYLTTRFDNPFDAAFFAAQGLPVGLGAELRPAGHRAGHRHAACRRDGQAGLGRRRWQRTATGVQMWTKGGGQPTSRRRRWRRWRAQV